VKILPYVRLTFRTPSGPDVVCARIAALIAPGWFYLTRPLQPFRGRIRGRQFKVVRILGMHRNSFQPVVIGDIEPGAFGGSEVRVRMRLIVLVAAFSVFWFSGVLFGGVIFLAQSIARRGSDPSAPGGFGMLAGLAVISAMAAFGYGLLRWGFWREVDIARTLLLEALGAGAEVKED
jgi:hypothetical protein